MFYIDEMTLDAHVSSSIFSMTLIESSSYRKPVRILNTCLRMVLRTRLIPILGHIFGTICVFHLSRLHNCLGLNKVTAEFEQQAPNRIEDASSVPLDVLYDVIELLSVSQLGEACMMQ